MELKFLCDNYRHLICLPYSISNLHRMAQILNIGRHWFHKNHYDIPKKRIDEIMSRCIVVSPKAIIKVIQGKSIRI